LEYLSLERGHLLTLLLPIAYIFYKLFHYEQVFFKGKLTKVIIIASILFSIPSSLYNVTV